MPQSLVKNYMHIVFSTKNRESLIHQPYEDELHNYLAMLCQKQECLPIKIGGYTNHVHILCMLSGKIALMTLVEKVKASSSGWMKNRDQSLSNFYWQNGYGGFSVSPNDVDSVISYISNQHAHHNGILFQDEHRKMLNDHAAEYDERYVWD
ncbi:IS200/IS605 family transposase [Mucilaginibacter flavidus]|uniref:IS200/IS605 family transposase n=1 Tax=Mucilaginibacter flavidus TaxID=2949309 RepID=UPI00209231CE|nr:IS200/IS605 family transposase [Mucilaginibacter flavidus]MCO5946227.1 IS200/IS605 family transposase [Mucilaginibacter flavidus]